MGREWRADEHGKGKYAEEGLGPELGPDRIEEARRLRGSVDQKSQGRIMGQSLQTSDQLSLLGSQAPSQLSGLRFPSETFELWPTGPRVNRSTNGVFPHVPLPPCPLAP